MPATTATPTANQRRADRVRPAGGRDQYRPLATARSTTPCTIADTARRHRRHDARERQPSRSPAAPHKTPTAAASRPLSGPAAPPCEGQAGPAAECSVAPQTAGLPQVRASWHAEHAHASPADECRRRRPVILGSARASPGRRRASGQASGRTLAVGYDVVGRRVDDAREDERMEARRWSEDGASTPGGIGRCSRRRTRAVKVSRRRARRSARRVPNV